MKKIIFLVLAVIACFSFVGCGGIDGSGESFAAVTDKKVTEVMPIAVDGTEVSVKDFLIENLSEYIDSDGFKEIQQAFRDGLGKEPEPLKVTNVIEYALEGKYTNSIDMHFLLIQADFQWGVLSDSWYGNSMMLLADYDTGKVYDPTMVDESWCKESGSKEYWIYFMLNCYYSAEPYDGRMLLNEAEIQRVLTQDDIAEINAALYS